MINNIDLSIPVDIALERDSSHHFDAPKQHLFNRQQPVDENW